jgi:hypothetical protein
LMTRACLMTGGACLMTGACLMMGARLMTGARLRANAGGAPLPLIPRHSVRAMLLGTSRRAVSYALALGCGGRPLSWAPLHRP